MEDEKSHWHWEQGTKYAVEGIKTTLLLNGAAAIALMTFATTSPAISNARRFLVEVARRAL
jgi:hypothetical protein